TLERHRPSLGPARGRRLDRVYMSVWPPVDTPSQAAPRSLPPASPSRVAAAPSTEREEADAYVVGLSAMAQPRGQRVAAHRRDARRADERAGACRALRRGHAEAVVGQLDDAVVRHLR